LALAQGYGLKIAQLLGLDGVFITRIAPDGPAAAFPAELRLGDAIIAVNGQPVTAAAYAEVTALFLAHSTVTLTLIARSEALETIAAAAAEEVPARTVVLNRGGKTLGMKLTALHDGGAGVESLVPGGLAEESGRVHAGDVLLAVNGAPVRHLPYKDLLLVLKEAGPTVTLQLQAA
jgi:C-terminal processing protease CtpA/Prc